MKTKISKETIKKCEKESPNGRCNDCACNEKECLEVLWYVLNGHFKESEK